MVKVGKHTKFMIEFITEFVNGEMDRLFFDLDYCAYVIEHFPYMEKENPSLADRFAYIVDQTYERGTDNDLSDEDFRDEIANALDAWLDRGKANKF